MRNKVFFQAVLIVGPALIVANLGSIIELVHHPDVAYFDKEHLIVGGITGLVTAVLFGFLVLYVRRLEKITKDLTDTNAMCTLEIMEHQKTTEALRQIEHLLSESQRLGHIGSFLMDATGFLKWSEELYHIYGVSPDTFVPNTESLLSLILPEDRAAMKVWIAACMAGEKPTALDFRINFPDGTIHFIRGDGEAVFDNENRFLYLAGSGQDITERKLAEEALQQYSVELEKNNKALQEALANVKQLSAMLPICASCKKVRDDKGYWSEVESYLSEHTKTVFSHGICPDCEKNAYEDLKDLTNENADSLGSDG